MLCGVGCYEEGAKGYLPGITTWWPVIHIYFAKRALESKISLFIT